MSYHDDDIKPSNRTYALRPGDTPVWNYVESHPDDKHIVSFIVLFIINLIVFIDLLKVRITLF